MHAPQSDPKLSTTAARANANPYLWGPHTVFLVVLGVEARASTLGYISSLFYFLFLRKISVSCSGWAGI